MSCGSALGSTRTGAAVVDHRRHGTDGIGHDRAAGHVGFDHDAGDAFTVAREQQQVERTEQDLDVIAVSEHMHEPARAIGLRAASTNAGSSGPVPATTRWASAPVARDASEHIEGAFGPLLFDQVPDESEQRGFRRDRRARRAIACSPRRGRRRRSAPGARKLGIVHTGPAKPRARSSCSIAGASATAASTRRHTTRHQRVRRPPRHAGREVEDALPHHGRA